ncbi:hypothetical protein EN35_07435 [Rhodococcus qingshengii]|nr:hypothetical protein EN35_07435 [Rhodococcus qingshengii]
MDGVYEVLDAIASADIQPGGRRVKPLIALPTFGVGLGGQGMVRGHVIKALIELRWNVPTNTTSTSHS